MYISLAFFKIFLLFRLMFKMFLLRVHARRFLGQARYITFICFFSFLVEEIFLQREAVLAGLSLIYIQFCINDT